MEEGLLRGFRRSALAKALAGWLTLVAILCLGSVPIFELVGYYAFKVLTAALGAGAVALIIWSVVRFASRPRTAWLDPLGVLAAFGLSLGLGVPLADAGLYLNFLRHKSAYDRIVADAKAGRLEGSLTDAGALTGVRYGEPFHVVRGTPPFVYFETWQVGDYYFFEVYYDELGCPAANRGRSRSPHPATMSLGYSVRLAGHYCLRKMIA